jgi:hypothetical protein
MVGGARAEAMVGQEGAEVERGAQGQAGSQQGGQTARASGLLSNLSIRPAIIS